MIRVKKENHRSWFMSNYYPCEWLADHGYTRTD